VDQDNEDVEQWPRGNERKDGSGGHVDGKKGRVGWIGGLFGGRREVGSPVG
jgi:hypothetical protein